MQLKQLKQNVFAVHHLCENMDKEFSEIWNKAITSVIRYMVSESMVQEIIVCFQSLA